MLARFDCRVGFTPKFTSRLMRFRKTLGTIAAAPAQPDWSDLAIDSGYYDQAHMIHEFQEFAEMTPAEYQQKQTDFPLYIHLD